MPGSTVAFDRTNFNGQVNGPIDDYSNTGSRIRDTMHRMPFVRLNLEPLQLHTACRSTPTPRSFAMADLASLPTSNT